MPKMRENPTKYFIYLVGRTTSRAITYTATITILGQLINEVGQRKDEIRKLATSVAT